MDKKFSQAEQEILSTADHMAAAATNFNGYGYDVFIQARDSFKELVHKWLEELSPDPA